MTVSISFSLEFPSKSGCEFTFSSEFLRNSGTNFKKARSLCVAVERNLKMNENLKLNESKSSYKYLQFTVNDREKKQIKQFAKKEKYTTISDFLRRIVFEYVRREENPDMFKADESNSINPLQMERLNTQLRELRRNQELILEHEDHISEMKEMITDLYKMAEANSLSEEREKIIGLLEDHTSLSLRQLKDKSNINEDVIFKIIS
ncbi:MAG: hypothetical protein P8Y97_16860, partial [Candidatus Lokiarchaeota archaeon]